MTGVPPPPPFDLEAALARLDTQMAADIRSLLALGNPHYGPGAIAFAKLAHARCWTARQADTVLEVVDAEMRKRRDALRAARGEPMPGRWTDPRAGGTDWDDDIPF